MVQGRRLETSNNPNAANAVMYGKGAWIMHMLRRRMGDERFLKMLAELRRRYEWKTLESFFDQWVYGTGVPTLKLTFAVKGAAGAYKLTGTVTQSDAPEDFSVAVPVEVQTGRAKPAVQVVRTSSDPASASSLHCVTVPAMSAVSVLVMDCTTIGASAPTRTPPTTAVTVFLR